MLLLLMLGLFAIGDLWFLSLDYNSLGLRTLPPVLPPLLAATCACCLSILLSLSLALASDSAVFLASPTLTSPTSIRSSVLRGGEASLIALG